MLYNYPQILYNYPLYIYHEKIGGLISDHGLITFWLSTTRPWQCRRRQCGILCSNCHGRGSHMAEAVLGKMLGMESWIEFWECWLFFTTFSHTHFDFFRFYLSKLEVSAFVFDLFPFMARSVGTLKQCATTVTGNASVVVFNMGTGVSWSKVGFNHKNRTLWFKL